MILKDKNTDFHASLYSRILMCDAFLVIGNNSLLVIMTSQIQLVVNDVNRQEFLLQSELMSYHKYGQFLERKRE